MTDFLYWFGVVYLAGVVATFGVCVYWHFTVGRHNSDFSIIERSRRGGYVSTILIFLGILLWPISINLFFKTIDNYEKGE